eukprot:ctg_1172.g372
MPRGSSVHRSEAPSPTTLPEAPAAGGRGALDQGVAPPERLEGNDAEATRGDRPAAADPDANPPVSSREDGDVSDGRNSSESDVGDRSRATRPPQFCEMSYSGNMRPEWLAMESVLSPRQRFLEQRGRYFGSRGNDARTAGGYTVPPSRSAPTPNTLGGRKRPRVSGAMPTRPTPSTSSSDVGDHCTDVCAPTYAYGSAQRPVRWNAVPPDPSLAYLFGGRAGHAMAAVHHRVYIFGGYNVLRGNDAAETVPVTGVEERTSPDGQRRIRHFSDLVEFDADSRRWRLVGGALPTTARPAPRRHASMVCFRNALYVYGGFNADDQVLGDLWCCDLNAGGEWRRMDVTMETSAAGAPGREITGIVAPADSAAIPAPPGEHSGPGSRRYVWLDGVGLVSYVDEAVARSGRAEHTAVVYKNFMVVFGGYDGRRKVNSTLVFDLHTHRWLVVKALLECHTHGRVGIDYPHRRCKHSAVVYRHRMYVFGGFQYRDGANYACSDMFVLNLDTWLWEGPVLMHGQPPAAMQGHRAVACLDSMYVFGGKIRADGTTALPPPPPPSGGNPSTPPELRSSGLSRHIWQYRFDVCKWFRVPVERAPVERAPGGASRMPRAVPVPRQLHGMAVTGEDNPRACTIYLFGGMDREKERFFGDMHELRGLLAFGHQLQPRCALCTDLERALNQPEWADVEFALTAESTEEDWVGHTDTTIAGVLVNASATATTTTTTLSSADTASSTHVAAAPDVRSETGDTASAEESPEAHRAPPPSTAATVRFFAHRVILAARSEYFANMFRSGLLESCSSTAHARLTIPIADVSPSVFWAMLRYLYTGQVVFPDRLQADASDAAASAEQRGRFALRLLQAADRFGLETLCSTCVSLVERAITIHNVAFVLEVSASGLQGTSGLKSYCLSFIVHNFRRVIETDSWHQLLRRDPGGLGQEVLRAYYESTHTESTNSRTL